MNIPKLIGIREVPHKATFNAGPRITQVQTIQTDGGLVEVDIWTENGRVVKVSEPRKVS